MPPTQDIPVIQRAKRADPVSDTTWEKHRKTITDLYFKIKFEDLVSHMEKECGFSARQVVGTVNSIDEN